MDSVAQLALILKAKKVFEKKSTFLSFPVTPLAYQPEDLEFFSQTDAADLIRNKKNLYAFSTLVNLIPDNEAWMPTESRFLWDEYEYVLDNAICAESTRTSAEETAFQNAKAFLKIPDDGGIAHDSPALQAYKKYRDEYFVLEEQYMEARSTGEAETSEVEKRKWRDIDEPAFLSELKDLERKWILDGYKNEVEIAQDTIVKLGAKSPILTWSEWQEQFDPHLNSETGLTDLSRVFPSTFTPYNALDDGSWKPFSLTEVEVKSLVNTASPSLRQQFSAEGIKSTIKSITFEFSSAAIVRPWFDPEVFRSHFWRLPDPNHIISEGGKPPAGTCPAYSTAIVFARNITVKLQSQHGRTTPTTSAKLCFNYALKNQVKLQKINPALMKAVNPPPMPVQHAARLRRTAGVVALRSSPTNIPVAKVRKPKVSTFARIPRDPIRLKLHRLALQPSDFRTVADSSIYVFAFICKPLPKSPDPDPALEWPF